MSDSVRQRLIALQGQVSSNIRGTLKYNLEFGLPKHQKRYTDRDLVEVLKKVGLWSMFEYKKGLETFVGEGGSNFSGGQRQRLNFANLYLRANFYNPPLILIDEPTSSLDEISERAITGMINELAEHAVTMVIAHRLNTINDAVGIMDAGLLATEKEVNFYDHKELKEHSLYYRSLLAGQASLED